MTYVRSWPNFVPFSQVIFDLHLPAMACLTGKRSSQNLLLRVLKVVIQLREAAKKSLVKGPNQPRTGLSRGRFKRQCSLLIPDEFVP